MEQHTGEREDGAYYDPAVRVMVRPAAKARWRERLARKPDYTELRERIGLPPKTA